MYNIEKVKNSIIYGNALSVLKEFPSDSIDCIVTSSPYYGLRSYGTNPQIWGGLDTCNHIWDYSIKRGISGGTKSKKVQIKGIDNFQITNDSEHDTCSCCGAWLGELGQEPTHLMFIQHLTDIFMECSRVLKPQGTMWINIADSYAANRTYQVNGTKQTPNSQPTKYKQPQAKDMGLKSKSLIGIPDRIKLSLIDNGLICRNQIIWHRPNQMPSSAKDRFTNDYEMLYFFTKNEKYFFQQQIEPYTKPMNRWGGDNLEANGKSDWDDGTGQETYRTRNMRPNPNGKNMRTVWSINTKPNKVAHFATFPQALPERCILAGCPEGGIVLDPFFGSGTTGIVAKKNNRNYIGIDLNKEYIKIAEGLLNQ